MNKYTTGMISDPDGDYVYLPDHQAAIDAVLEEVRARIIAEHRMGDRDEWLDVAAWCRRQAEEGRR